MAPAVRRAGPQDAGLVARLNRHVQDWHAATYPGVFKPEPDAAALTAWFDSVLANPDCAVFLAGEPAQGYLSCTLLVRPDNPFAYAARRLMIDQIGVAPVARRQGLGQALFDAAMDHARAMACTDVILDTWGENRDAHAFFRAQGFAPRRMLFYRPVDPPPASLAP